MSILEEIFAEKRARVASCKPSGLDDVKVRAADAGPVRPFSAALLSSAHRPSLIAEVKRMSPSQGVICPDFRPLEIAAAFESAGADCLSVLTDEKWFGGSEEVFRAIRPTVALPMLRKDFVVDEYDVYAARAMGADAILLIVAGLTLGQLSGFQGLAWELGMDVLVEVHTAGEAEIALASGAKMIGVNNRNLHDFVENLETTESIFPRLSRESLLVSESSLKSNADVHRVAAAGARSVLIGTAFCRSDDPGGAVRSIMGW
ncbi:MAG: indole-3-glycerol phosphate synthase TrpC [Armatimonadetes bacterium]|nr:indole-3-glycerol phosphate synthase TrpC [Armatimonadota bacterium]MBX3109144.1 indole-3-glycerol phosphate synthase TrpC [Fimbriimonadaceae bacterium]